MGRFVRKGDKRIRVLAQVSCKIELEQDKLDKKGKPVLDKVGEEVKKCIL